MIRSSENLLTFMIFSENIHIISHTQYFSFISSVHFDLTHTQMIQWIYHFNLIPLGSRWALEYNPNTRSGFSC